MHSMNVRQRFSQSPEQVFALFDTHAKLNRLFWPLQVVRSQDASDPHCPDGVGSVRRMGIGLLKPIAEQITAFEPHYRIEYTLISKTPINNHLGRLTFTPDGHGTIVDYYIELDSAVPFLAPIVLGTLQTALRVGLARLARTL